MARYDCSWLSRVFQLTGEGGRGGGTGGGQGGHGPPKNLSGWATGPPKTQYPYIKIFCAFNFFEYIYKNSVSCIK